MPIKELMGKGGEKWFFSGYLNSFGYLDNMAISLIVKGTTTWICQGMTTWVNANWRVNREKQGKIKSKPISDTFFWLFQLKQPNNQQKVHSIPSQKPSHARERSRGKNGWFYLAWSSLVVLVTLNTIYKFTCMYLWSTMVWMYKGKVKKWSIKQ